MSPEDVECIVACAGPGNKMGLRAVKMFIGTAEAIGMGKPIYAYNGLEAEARWIVRSMSLRDFSVIAPIGKKRGAAITVTGGILGKTFAVENSNFSGNGRTFAMDTGFLPADGNFEAAPEVPPNFLIGALATMAQSKTFAPIEL
jgi:hypothetical protein